jgi:DNA-binding NarL/FixJ family response regulator
VLTTFHLDEYVYGALRAGASGFLLKDATPEQLVDAVRTVAAGESLLAPGRDHPADRGVRATTSTRSCGSLGPRP